MADNILKVGTELDNGPLDSGLQQGVASTKAATEEMSAAFEKHAEAVSNAVKSIGAAAKAMGADVSDPVVDLIALMPELAAAIEGATSVSGALALIGVLAQVVVAVKAWGDSLSEVDAAEKKRHDDFVQHVKQEAKDQATLIKAAYDLQIANAPDEISKQRLRVELAGALARIQQGTVQQLQGQVDEYERVLRAQQHITQVAKDAAEVEQQGAEQGNEDLISGVALVQAVSQEKEKADAKEIARRQHDLDLAKEMQQEAAADQINAQHALDDDEKKAAEKHAAEKKRAAEKHAAEQKRVFQTELSATIAHIQALDGIERQKLEFQKQMGQLSEQEYESRLQGQLALTYAETRQQLEIELAAATKKPEEHARILAEIQKLDDKYQADSEKQEEQSDLRKKQKADAEKKKSEEEKKRSNEIELDAAIAHTEALGQIEVQRLDFDRQTGRLSESEYEKRLQDQLKKTYEAVHKELEIKLAAAAQDPVEYARIQAQIRKLEDKFTLDSEKREQQSLLRRRQKFHEYFQQISGAFTNALNSWIQGTETFSQAWTKMVQNIEMQFISSLEKQLTSFIEHKLMEVAVHTQAEETKDTVSTESHAKEGARTARTAAQHAYDSVVDTPIVGPVLAPIAAAATFLAVEALGSAEGGQWEVPGIQPTILHPQEMVLPASIASRMRDMVEGGGTMSSRSALVFAPTIHALDAHGVDSVLAKHQRIFENRVDKVLRKRGFFAR